MAANGSTLADEDNSFPDWIEIHNAGTNSVPLGGWFLTDSASNLRKWTFPATNLPPDSYLVVFASDKDRRVPGAPLHTSFNLSATGEFLALVRPDGTNVASAYGVSTTPSSGLTHRFMRLQRAGTLFTVLSKAAVGDAYGVRATTTRLDLAGLPLQVGV